MRMVLLEWAAEKKGFTEINEPSLAIWLPLGTRESPKPRARNRAAGIDCPTGKSIVSVEINPKPLGGPWDGRYALDLHTQ
jgi:hypothetical protein